MQFDIYSYDRVDWRTKRTKLSYSCLCV